MVIEYLSSVLDFKDKSTRRISGIYCIRNILTGKIYIGSAIDLNQRKNVHAYSLGRHKYSNINLQTEYDIYGKESFIFEIWEIVNQKDDLIPIEQNYLDLVSKYMTGRLYNICMTAGSILGITFSQEARDKISKTHLGKKKSDETRRKMSESLIGNTRNLGRSPSEETRKKMSEWQIGREIPESTKKKLSNNFKNRKLSDEQVLEIRKRLAGGESVKALHEYYGVSKSSIWRIKNHQAWRYIE